MWGISVYAGLGMPNIAEYIKKSSGLGASKAFTSLHIPESSPELMKEFYLILDTCAQEDLPIYVDTSGKHYNKLPFDLYPKLSIRLDFGFSNEEIVQLSQKHSLVLNTSTLSLEQIEQLKNSGIDFSSLSACHNYYPRPETGLSTTFFQEKNVLCASYGIKSDAFITGSSWKRPPINEGLPSIERHRHLPPLIAAQECIALGASCVFFGDMAADKELEHLALLKDGLWVLPVEWADSTPLLLKTSVHQNRSDPGDGIIRSEYQRSLENIPPFNCTQRLKGSVTLDNIHYSRYQGELQITTKNLPADSRVNVIGTVHDNGVLIDYIKPKDKWIFIE